MLEYSLCNELLAGEGHDLSAQANIAQQLGYVGLEIAPATLGDQPHNLDDAAAGEIRRQIEDENVRVTGLHWLLSGYPDASITDGARQEETADILFGLIDLCAALGGRVMVHGSPQQRLRPQNMHAAALQDHLAEFFTPIAHHAQQCGISYCIEPLAPVETDVLTSVAEAADLVKVVDNPAFRTMIDCSAAGQSEPPVTDLIRQWVPTGMIDHIHANDSNRGAPGMGNDPFDKIVAALIACGWDEPIGVEPFRCMVDASVTAATGIATLRACEQVAS